MTSHQKLSLISYLSKKMGPFAGAEVVIVVISHGRTWPRCFIAF